MTEEAIIQLADRKLVYEECSKEEASGTLHIVIFFIRGKPFRYFRLKEVKELLVG